MTDLPRGGHLKVDDETLSTADWARDDQLVQAGWRLESSLARIQGSFFLGRSARSHKYIGIYDDRHVVTIAGSRAGKGRSAIIPNLAMWPGSVVVLDPKGENAAATARARHRIGQRVVVLDPFDTVGGRNSAEFAGRFNPLDLLRHAAHPVDEAALLADALVVSEATGRDKFFDDAARNLLQGLILYTFCSGASREDSNGSLVEMRDLLADPDRRHGALGMMVSLRDDTRSPDAQAVAQAITASAATFLEKSERERTTVLSTALEHTAFLTSPGMRTVLGGSDVDLQGLRGRSGLSLYIALPARFLRVHDRFARLVFTCVVSTLEGMGPHRDDHGPRVLACLDEFPVLGHLEIMEGVVGYMAGFGLKIWTILQDLPQLQRHYPDSWETFLNNAGVIQAFGNTDSTTLKHLSDALGERVVVKRSASSQGLLQGVTSRSADLQTVPLLRPDEVRRCFAREKNTQLVVAPGPPPVACERVNWDSDQEIKKLLSG